MPKCEKLLDKAKNDPGSLSFSELCALAECWGYVKKGGAGSHQKFKHNELKLPQEEAMCVFQERKGKAKAYQVRQLLGKIEYIQKNYPNY